MYYVLWNGGAWFVKEATFFESQKASSATGDAWWKNWRAVHGASSVEHARDIARLQWGVYGQRW